MCNEGKAEKWKSTGGEKILIKKAFRQNTRIHYSPGARQEKIKKKLHSEAEHAP